MPKKIAAPDFGKNLIGAQVLEQRFRSNAMKFGKRSKRGPRPGFALTPAQAGSLNARLAIFWIPACAPKETLLGCAGMTDYVVPLVFGFEFFRLKNAMRF